MATEKARKDTMQKRMDQLKSRISGLHDEVLVASDSFVEMSLASGAKWQKLMATTLDKGTEMFEKQQDITLTALEEIKSQYLTGSKRLWKVLGLDNTKAKKKARLEKQSRSRNGRKVKDDLQQLQGVGPKIETLLNEAGITSFAKLAATPTKELREILKKAGPRYKSLDPTPWQKQAKNLSK